MKKITLFVLLPVLIISVTGCESKKDKLSRKWQAVRISNPEMEKMIAEQEIFIDTFGKNTDAQMNQTLYGVTNIDSFRESLKTQVNDFKAMQEHSLKTTWFDFKKNGVVVMNFSGQVDSTKWYFDDKDELMLDEMQMKGVGEKIRMVIQELTDTSLKLQFNEDGISSTITFHPVK
jgi:hypothetical protein